MTVAALHAPLSRVARTWLVEMVRGESHTWPHPPPLPPGEVSQVLAAAELHGVLPAALRRLGVEQAAPLSESGARDCATTAARAAIETAREKHVNQVGLQLLLQHYLSLVSARMAANGIRAVAIKGPVFARRLYNEATLRSFTDIDILIEPAARGVAGEVMRDLGFEGHELAYRSGQDYFEDKWVLPSDKRITFELHSDLVHNPRLRRSCSVQLDDVMAAGAGDAEDATALLFVAATHAVVSHQLDRLQHLLDVSMAAGGLGGPIDRNRLAEAAKRSGATAAVYAAISAAGSILRNAAVTRIGAELRPTTAARLVSQLLTERTVLDARSTLRHRASWRRKLLRQVIRANGRR